MLEIALAGLFVTVAVVVIGKTDRRDAWASPDALIPALDENVLPDLPCPWCSSQTDEDDRACPSCGQPFG